MYKLIQGGPQKYVYFSLTITFTKKGNLQDFFTIDTGSLLNSFDVNHSRIRHHLISRTEHLNTSGITSHGTDSFHVKLITPGHPIPKISTCLTIFWGGNWKTEFVKTIHRQERTSSEKKSDELHKKCSIELWTILVVAVLSYSRSAWNKHSINYSKNAVKRYWFHSGLHEKNSINFQYLWRKNLEGFLIFVKVIPKEK